ncbi:hypothetical protein OROMI_026760 [Orobanche minor]
MLDVPSNVAQKKIVARILVFKIRPSHEILKIRDGTPLEAEGILTYRKGPRNCSVWHYSSKLDVPSNVAQKKRVARILVFKSGMNFDIPEKALENCSVWQFSSKLDIPSNVVQKKRVARILVFKIRPSQEILKIRDGTPLEAEGILTYRKKPSKLLGLALSSKLDVPSNVVQKKIVARILVFKIRPSHEILKIRDATPLEAEGILTYRKRPSKLLEILKIRDGTSLEKKIVARILVFKIRPSHEILKIRDGTPLEAEGILTYRKGPRNCSVWHYSSKLDVPSNVAQKKRVARILVFKIRMNFDIPEKALENCSVWQFSSKLDIPSNVVQKKRVARILVFKIRPSQEILKIRDGTPLEAEGILTYRKKPSKLLGLALSSKLDVPSNVVQKKIVARILVFKIRPSHEILKIRDATPLEAEGILTYRKRPSKLLEILKIRDVARILVFKIRPSHEILKIRDGTPLEAEGILTYRKGPRNCSVWHYSSKLDVPSNVAQKKRVARILVFKIRPSQEILKIRDGTPLEKKRVARILVFKIRPSQEILKIRDGTPLEAEGILTYRKKPSKLLGLALSSKLDVPSNVVQKKIVARILVFKIRPSHEILKIRDATPLEAEGILTYRKRPSKLLGLALF